jgi:hypothetical protein
MLAEAKASEEKKVGLANLWKNAPKLKPITNWFLRGLDAFNGGIDFNGFHYDVDGNPTGPAPVSLQLEVEISKLSA